MSEWHLLSPKHERLCSRLSMMSASLTQQRLKDIFGQGRTVHGPMKSKNSQVENLNLIDRFEIFDFLTTVWINYNHWFNHDHALLTVIAQIGHKTKNIIVQSEATSCSDLTFIVIFISVHDVVFTGSNYFFRVGNLSF